MKGNKDMHNGNKTRKIRRTWGFNPKERIHSDGKKGGQAYDRNAVKRLDMDDYDDMDKVVR